MCSRPFVHLNDKCHSPNLLNVLILAVYREQAPI